MFGSEGAAGSLEQCLFEACEAFSWRLHAFVIMRNHFHLAVETPEPNLSLGMKWLQGTWAMRFNRYRGESGRPFQGRYKALHVEPGHALAQVAHYIHLNPVRAGLVDSEQLLDYRRSSLPWFKNRQRPKCLEASTVLAESGGLPDTRAGWNRYLAYLGVLAEEDAKLREKQFGRLSRGWLIGSQAFRNELKQELAKVADPKTSLALLGADREAHRLAREVVWEQSLEEVATALAIALDELPSAKSSPAKLALATAMKRTTSVSNRWLAERLQMGQASSVATILRRFQSHPDASSSRMKGVLSRFAT